MTKTFLRILAQLGWPKIYEIDPAQFYHVDGETIRGLYGNSSVHEPIITRDTHLRGRVLLNTYWHEVIHKLHPDWPEWMVWLGGTIMARGGADGQECPPDENGVIHTIDEMPSRDDLLEDLRRATKRYNRRKR